MVSVKRVLSHLRKYKGRIRTALILLAAGLLVVLFLRSRPVGGEVFAPDLKHGVSVYVEEGYTFFLNDEGIFEETPHSIWLVSDETLQEEILELCGKIRHFREFNSLYDVVLGTPPSMTYFPQICLITDSCCYRIRLLNWDNYASPAWSALRIRQEAYGKPVAFVYRIDLSLKPEGEAAYTFVSGYSGRDTLNSRDGEGWYSAVETWADMDALLALLESVGPENAEEIEKLPS